MAAQAAAGCEGQSTVPPMAPSHLAQAFFASQRHQGLPGDPEENRGKWKCRRQSCEQCQGGNADGEGERQLLHAPYPRASICF
jgi:hypothetical protein